MNNNKKELINLRIEYLYERLTEISDACSDMQMDFILKEIDYSKTELLKLELDEFCKRISDESA